MWSSAANTESIESFSFAGHKLNCMHIAHHILFIYLIHVLHHIKSIFPLPNGSYECDMRESRWKLPLAGCREAFFSKAAVNENGSHPTWSIILVQTNRCCTRHNAEPQLCYPVQLAGHEPTTTVSVFRVTQNVQQTVHNHIILCTYYFHFYW